MARQWLRSAKPFKKKLNLLRVGEDELQPDRDLESDAHAWVEVDVHVTTVVAGDLVLVHVWRRMLPECRLVLILRTTACLGGLLAKEQTKRL